MSNLATRESALPALQMEEAELVKVLQTSLYPGAALESIKMVLGYCKASNLDPMQKPVHIVPMWDSKSGSMRDVIMPGVGLYRTQAARNGCAGVTEPDFGPDTTEEIGGQRITFPSWCRVTVKRKLSDGAIVEFTAKEFWKENYAVRGGKEKSIAPNAMWTKRPYGQIAKCAEAQALRKAFPEIGSEPTAEEMQGKPLHEESGVIDSSTGEITQPQQRPALPACQDEKFKTMLPKWRKNIEEGGIVSDLLSMLQSKYTLTQDQIKAINDLAVTDAQPKEPAASLEDDPFVQGMQ